MIEVAAAVIRDRDRFLICRRPEHKAQGLLWEFPGGKREPGETLCECLLRECREELGVTLEVGEAITEVTHDYPGFTVRLTFFSARIVSGVLRLSEHSDARWIWPNEIGGFEFCPADGKALEALKKSILPNASTKKL